MTETAQTPDLQQHHRRTLQPEQALPESQHAGFKPVKVSSLTDPVPGQAAVEAHTDLKLNISNASADSGYNSGSMSSCPVVFDHSRYKHRKATAAHVVQDDAPVPDHELNYDALKIPFQDFTNGETAGYDDVGSSEFNEYWTASYGRETS